MSKFIGLLSLKKETDKLKDFAHRREPQNNCYAHIITVLKGVAKMSKKLSVTGF
jgi:hypothetical protein